MIKASVASGFRRPSVTGSTTEEGVDNPRVDMAEGDIKLWKNFS